jgi:transposase
MGYYCGIDLGNKSTEVCVIQKNRQLVAAFEIGTKSSEIRKSLKGYRKLTCIVEASPLAEWFCKEVEKLGHEITVVCPRKAKAALSGRSGKKTDMRERWRSCVEAVGMNRCIARARKPGRCEAT